MQLVHPRLRDQRHVTLREINNTLGKCAFDQTGVSGLWRRIDSLGTKILGQAMRKVAIIALHFLAIGLAKAKKFRAGFVL